MAIKTVNAMTARWIYLLEAQLHDPINRNRLVWSDDLTQADWSKSGVTASASAKTDPDGGTSAIKLDTANAAADERVEQSFDRIGTIKHGVLVLVALQADSTTTQDRRIGIAIQDRSSSQFYTPSQCVLRYGSGRSELITGGSDRIVIHELSNTSWTLVECTWSSDDETFDTDLRLILYPGDRAQSDAQVHVWRVHLEDESAPDGRGFRSRGQRLTEEINGPDGAPGQDVILRAGSETFITGNSDSYPTESGGGSYAHKMFTEGLTSPATVGKTAWIDQVVGGDGIVRTTVAGAEFDNTGRIRDQWAGYSWRGRRVRIWRGVREAQFSQFSQVYDGVAGKESVSTNSIRVPLRDPLQALDKELDREEFQGFAGCVRLDGTGDEVLFGQLPGAWIKGDLTVQLRFKVLGTITISGTTLIGYGATGATEPDNMVWGIYLDAANGYWTMIWEYGAGNTESANHNDVSDGPTLDDGEWHQLTVTRDSTAEEVLFYIDGDLYPHGTNADYTNHPTGGSEGILHVGEDPKASVPSWPGDIDDVRIWSRVLTQAEIRATIDRPLFAFSYRNDDLRHYWRFDENVGSYLFDDVTKDVDLHKPVEGYVATDGSTGYLQTNHHAQLNPTANAWTWEVRFALDDVGGAAFPIIVSKNQMYRTFVTKSNGNISVSAYLTGVTNDWVNVTASGADAYDFDQGGFVMVTGRWNGSTRQLAIYINGTFIDEQVVGSAGDSMNTNSNAIFWMAGSATPGNPARGWLAEARLWNGIKTGAQILDHYTNPLEGNEGNLKLWYDMREAVPKRSPVNLVRPGPDDPIYSGVTILDWQIETPEKKPVAASAGAALYHTAGSLTADARTVGSGEGDRNLEGQLKPYGNGPLKHVELHQVDGHRHVYVAIQRPMQEFTTLFDGARQLVHAEISSGDDVYDSDFIDYPDSVWVLYDGASGGASPWRDETTDATDAGTGDVQFLHSTPGSGAVDDGLYIGYSERMPQIDVLVHQVLGNLSGSGGDLDLRWQYWSGEAWEDLRGLLDATEGWRLGGPDDWISNRDKLNKNPLFHTKVEKDGTYHERVANVKWNIPSAWQKEDLDSIASAMFVGTLPGDTTARWWIRLGAVANPTAYDVAPTLTIIWTSPYDALTDAGTAQVMFNSPPTYKPTAHIKGDSTGGYVEDIPGITQQVIDRFYAQHGFAYQGSFGTGMPDYLASRYVGVGQAITGREHLGKLLAGSGLLLDTDRVGKLRMVEIPEPLSATVDGNIYGTPDQILTLDEKAVPDPAKTIRLSVLPYETKFSDSDLNQLLPFSLLQDAAKQWRTRSEVASLIDNADRYLDSEEVTLTLYLADHGATDGIDSQLARWATLLGEQRHAWTVRIPTGLIEHEIGYVVGLKTSRYGIWHGQEFATAQDGPAFVVLEYEDDLQNEITTLLLWGTNDA